MSFPLAVDDQFSCEWFNVQIGDDEEESGDGSVTVHKYDCGLDPDAYQKSLDGLFTDCAPAEDVGFKVTNVEGGNQENFNEQQVTDADGLASWTIPEPSQVTVQEQFLPGYGDPIVYCGFPSDPEYPSLYPTNVGTVNVALASNEQWHCYWFNVQTGEADEAGGKILIKKYSCENFHTPSPPDFIDINLLQLLAMYDS